MKDEWLRKKIEETAEAIARDATLLAEEARVCKTFLSKTSRSRAWVALAKLERLRSKLGCQMAVMGAGEPEKTTTP